MEKKVGIHVDQYGKFCEYLVRYETILDYNNIRHIRLDVSDNNFWDLVKDLDLFIFRWQHSDWYRELAHSILPIIEQNYAVKCFPNQSTCWHFDDKIRQYYLLRNIGFPMIESWIFWDLNKALEWINTAVFPVVFKLKTGAGSQNVILLSNKAAAKKYIHRMFTKGIKNHQISDWNATKWHDFSVSKKIHHWGGNLLRKLNGEDIDPSWQVQKNYILFQKFLPGNKFDTRITILGKRAFGYIRHVRKNDFRASGSGNFDVNPDLIDLRCVKIAFDTSLKLGFQSMTYDFLFDENHEPLFCEISYTFVDWMVQSCKGYWDPGLNWHEGHYWPQFCQLADALEEDLKQPEFSIRGR